MEDVDVIREMSDRNGKINTNKTRSSWLEKHEELLKYIVSRYHDSDTVNESIYRIFHGIEEKPVCPVCGKAVKFQKRYPICCSVSCGNIFSKDRRIKNSLEKYGVEHPTMTNEVKDRMRKTSIERYGVENPAQSEDVKRKVVQTNLERYGVEFPMQSEEIKERSLNTCRERYGVDNVMHNDEVKDKVRRTNLERYGVPSASMLDEVKRKTEQTNMLRYGVCHPMEYEEFIEKSKNTNLTRYGAEFSCLSDNNRSKSKKTCMERYGTEYAIAAKEVQKKISETMNERYGGMPLKNEQCRNTIFRKLFSKETCEKRLDTRRKNQTFNTSKIEKEFKEYLEANYKDDFLCQFKSERYPFLCDFYIISLNLYIEIQGNWTHGKHPFDVNSAEDMKLIDKWREKKTKYYDNAIKVWSVSDVLKRQTAEANNLNYLEIFSHRIEEAIEIFNDFLNSK